MKKTLLVLALIASTCASAGDVSSDSLMIQACQLKAEAAEAVDETKFVSTLYACFKASGSEWARNLGNGDGEEFGGFTDSDVGCVNDCLDSE